MIPINRYAEQYQKTANLQESQEAQRERFLAMLNVPKMEQEESIVEWEKKQDWLKTK